MAARAQCLPVAKMGDKALRYENVIDVLDALQKGQIKRVGLLVKPGT